MSMLLSWQKFQNSDLVKEEPKSVMIRLGTPNLCVIPSSFLSFVFSLFIFFLFSFFYFLYLSPFFTFFSPLLFQASQG